MNRTIEQSNNFASRSAFTLVEMLIVVVVLVTLMSITFRLSSAGEDQTKRSRTIQRLQRVENCLSGYMAAFGTYPPVPLHNRRNVNLAVDTNSGVQLDPKGGSATTGYDVMKSLQDSEECWRQVRAACEAQPIGCYYPFPSTQEYKEAARIGSQEAQKRKYKVQQYTVPDIGGFDVNAQDWRKQQIFQFGLLSFLLPRYLLMMDIDSSSWSHLERTKQWTANNSLPFNPMTGERFDYWQDINDRVLMYSSNKRKYAEVANITSQAICARWISNLKNICQCYPSRNFYGIELQEGDCTSPLIGNDPNVRVYTSGAGGYILDGITILDGWESPLYYYSPAPHQTYTLWSAGKNTKTFPPWIDRNKLSSSSNEVVSKWTADDLIRMSN